MMVGEHKTISLEAKGLFSWGREDSEGTMQAFFTCVKHSLVVSWHRVWDRLRLTSWSLFCVALDKAPGLSESFMVTPGM